MRLIVDGRDEELRPIGLHLLPMSERLEPLLAEPLGLLLLGGDEAHGALIETQRRLLTLHITKEAVFVTLPGQRGDFFQGLRTSWRAIYVPHLQRGGWADY
jgi:hypothetical protein